MKFPLLTSLFAAALAVALFVTPLRADPVTPAQPAPGWTLKDVNGQPVSLSQFKGKVVVLDFWATWCPPCRSEIPGYVKLQEKYKGKGLVIIGVSVDQDGPAVVKKFVADFHMNYPVVMADDSVVQAYGNPDAIPTTFIIDRAGKIRDKKVGAMETADYEKILQQYLD
ncbi:MAG TPA: TlpA disulfide reductase family protein [Opitutaceae bacterium]|nr:TlpA disulfide reductase family protein [Opitutaceae bacterium]